MKYSLPGYMPKTVKSMPHSPAERNNESASIRFRTMSGVFHSYLELSKIRIALFAALSAATGSILARSAPSAGTFISAAGVFLIACGAGALNQYQERKSDALMLRTRSRPLPSGRISPPESLYAAALFIVSGLLTLSLAGRLIVSGLAVFAVFWYNLLYTNLKKISAFAAVPGALTGAVPPAIGWTAAGGSLSDIRLASICFFFFMWQVPHFWLLLLSHAEDFRQTKTPSLHNIFSQKQLIRVTAVWMFATAVSSLLLPFYGLAVSAVVNGTLLFAAAWITWDSLTLYRQKELKPAFARTFRNINIYMVIIMLLLNAGSLF